MNLNLKVIIFASICIGVLLTSAGIAALCGAFKGDETQLSFVDKQGRNMTAFIVEKCSISSPEDCQILKNNMNSKINEWIKENKLNECAIVKMAENNCKETNDLVCDEGSCSPSEEKTNELEFWFQDSFEVTNENKETVKNNSNIQSFTCIKQDSTEGLEDKGVCIKKSSLVGGMGTFENFVEKYLAKNLQNYTRLGNEVANMIDYQKLPYGTNIYSKFGKKLDSKSNGDHFVLPSESLVTKDAISSMNYKWDIPQAICNSFGLRKLTKKEINSLPENPNIDCFYDKEGKKLEKKEDIVWAFGKNVGTNKNYVEKIDTETLRFASKIRDFLIVRNAKSVTVPDNLAVIHENVIIKKSGSRVVYSPSMKCSEFEENEGFKKLLTDGFVILSCKEPKNNHFQVENYHLYSMEMEKLPVLFNENLLQSKIGQSFFVLYGEIQGETLLSHIDFKTCRNLLKERNMDSNFKIDKVECLEKYEKTFVIKK